MNLFSSTTDLWSSIHVGMRPYMSYTIDFIDEEWKLNSRCLQTHFIPEDHTGENLAEAMEASLDAWDLDVTNQVCLKTDSGTYIIKAAADLGWPRVSCFGHNMHPVITKTLDNKHVPELLHFVGD